MKPAVLPEPRSVEAEPLSAAELRGLKDALDRLLEYEQREWPSRERYSYIQQLERLRHKVAEQIPSPA